MARGRWMTGFSLVELMAAVAVVSILVGLALPRFRAFIARSRMAEAKTNLGILATLAQSYEVEYGSCCPSIAMGNTATSPALGCGASGCGDPQKKNELGFRTVKACTELRYCYTGSRPFTANANATEIYPSCEDNTAVDTWTINTERNLRHTSSAIEHCSQ